MPSIQLEQGTIHYRQAGPASGRPVVFVHGVLMAGDLWSGLGERLAARGLRAVMPTWPLGSHPEPMRPGADVTPRGVARIIAAFLEASSSRTSCWSATTAAARSARSSPSTIPSASARSC